jgi:hypothetical protein
VKRFLIAVAASAVLAAEAAGGGLADAGSPGATFPESPNGNVSNACATVTSNPSQGFHDAATAAAIKAGLVTDACFGG